MSSKTIRFRNNGKELTVVSKKDIIECIDANITDKEILTELISQLEIDLDDNISNKKWTTFPYICSFRHPNTLPKDVSKMLADLYKNGSKEEFLLFRNTVRQSIIDTDVHRKRYNYITSIMVRKNIELYKYLKRKKGEHYALIQMWLLYNLKSLDHDVVENERLSYYGTEIDD